MKRPGQRRGAGGGYTARFRVSALAVAGCGAIALFGCRAPPEEAQGAAPSAKDGVAELAHRSAVIFAIRSAEYARASSAIPDDALADHDPEIRRAAARALSRIGDAHAVERLGKGLSDEDGEVVAWAAYGLGSVCPLGDARTVRALVTRATSLDAAAASTVGARHSAPSPFDALFDALARCGSETAERTLGAWLNGPSETRSSAALSLGRLAARTHRLDGATEVLLLGAASASPPVHGALSAFGELESVSDVTAKRLVQVAERSIREATRERAFAISALLPAGPLGVDLLAAALVDEKLSPTDRTLAATTLGRIGKPAQLALEGALAALVPAGVPFDQAWLEGHFAPLYAALSVLDPPGKQSDPLDRLAEAQIPGSASLFVVHRLVLLRCAAATALAGTASQATKLVQCDPDPNGRAGALAVLRVLDRGPLASGRRKVWANATRSKLSSVRRAAFALLPRHPEAAPVVDELVLALSAPEPGVVAQAARVLSDAPRLGSARPPDAPAKEATGASDTDPAPAIVEALARAMDAERPADQIETRVALAAAAGGVGALSLKPRLERYCASDNVTLRESAESALHSLGATGIVCDKPNANPAVFAPPKDPGPVTLTFVTDAGRLGMTLDPSLSPLAVERILELARKGLYDKMSILRVSPGYIVQFGDPTGDGSGGSGSPPLPSEGAPVPFGALSVGLALGGRDTGSSQIFVTLAEEPQLFGDYPKIGSADSDWSTVAEGDAILRVEIHE